MEQIFILKEAKGKICSPIEFFKKLKRIKMDFSQENFIVVCFNTQNQVIDYKIVCKGILDACIISPSIVFKNAIIKGASKIAIGHNHPSNNLSPSREDEEVFKHLKKCGELLQIEVIDCIIFNKKEFFSIINLK
jgi:DNA repair protein RadC